MDVQLQGQSFGCKGDSCFLHPGCEYLPEIILPVTIRCLDSTFPCARHVQSARSPAHKRREKLTRTFSLHSVELRGHGRADDAGDGAESCQHAEDANSEHHGWHALAICRHCCGWGHHDCWHCSPGSDFERGASTELCGWSRPAKEGKAVQSDARNQGDAGCDQLGGARHLG